MRMALRRARRPSSQARCVGGRGLTLIEVMVSLAVLAMLMISVWSSFKGTLRAMEVSEQIQDRYAIVRNGMLRMETELSMAYLSLNQIEAAINFSKYYTLFEGRDEFDSDSVTFSAFAHLRMRKDANESDQSVIQYFLGSDPEDKSRTHLYRRESRRLTGDRPEDMERFFPAYVLVEDVVSFDVQYWDPTKIEWVDEWRTTANDYQPNRLPTRVKIKLGVQDGDDVVYFGTQVPLMMQEPIDLSKGQQ
ncbi:type II secretion system protein GspJ [Paraliomyxa miuraensis]|uniref:type II secretion system protein GspJ n=1 Tax=Paraliomyxa miuraensis TaxID=376150 RepID=UPI00225B6ABC|nr:type II secretion system protein GspJ [Paraliomyxa miuraensis]MCX4242954.1 prepilin-type N-terminal cleavage/methylation domain-containing protein [Paraliomyxa miuraensis]